jgi:flagellar hook assembly protein FlgD
VRSGARLAASEICLPHHRAVTLIAAASAALGVLAAPGVAHAAGALNPVIESISPNPFSPNGNSVDTSTVVRYTLDVDQSVVVDVTAGATPGGTLVREETLNAQPAGAHDWTWQGTNQSNQPVADGVYTITLNTSTGTDTGTASATVEVDSTPPGLSSASGSGITFYPYPDGYQDTFTPKVTLSEASTLELVITNSSNTVVRTIVASKPAGRASLTWNGRNTAKHLVAAGIYHWKFRVTDSAGNTAATSRYTVYLSGKRLVTKSKTLTVNGNSYIATRRYGTITNARSGVSKTKSTFTHGGALITNACNPASRLGPQAHVGMMAAFYRFTIPTAIRYGDLTVRAYGFAHKKLVPSDLSAAAYSYKGGYYEGTSVPVIKIKSSTKSWHALGHLSAAGHYSPQHIVKIGFGVINDLGPSDYDLRHVQLTVTYTILQ